MNSKQLQLRKHKRIATSLFLLMAVVYFLMAYLTKDNPSGWKMYVKAFAEAGMVGALADWFAVVALFGYPLGLKIPHTNLIENSKNSIGNNLGSFVSENFLTPKAIRPYVERLDVVKFLNIWLSKDKNIDLVLYQIQNIIGDILVKLDDEKVSETISKKAIEWIEEIKLEQWASKGVHYVVNNNEHNKLVTKLIPKVMDYVNNNSKVIYDAVIDKYPILAIVGGETVTNHLVAGISNYLAEVKNNENHNLRQEITLELKNLANEFVSNPEWKDKFLHIKQEFISEENMQQHISKIWNNLRKELLDNLHNEEYFIHKFLKKNIKRIADEMSENVELQYKINGFVKQFIYRLALKNISEVSNIISKTVEKWDGKELSEKLELEVGKDLQFIRINGTLVGGFVGLLIYAITHLFI